MATVMAIAVLASDVAVAARGKAASKAFSGIASAMAAALGLTRAAFRPVLSDISAVVARIGAAGAVLASDVAVAARGKAASKAFSGIGAAMATALRLIRAAFRPVLSAIAAVVARISAAGAVSASDVAVTARGKAAAKAVAGIASAIAATLGLIRAAFRPVLSAIAVVVARISMMISATSVATAVSRLVSQIFSRLFLTPSSPRPSTKHYATPALLTVAFRCIRTARSVVWNFCSKLKSSQIARIWCSAFSSLAGVAYSLTFVKDFALKTPALLSLAFNNFYTKSRRQDLLKNSLKQRLQSSQGSRIRKGAFNVMFLNLKFIQSVRRGGWTSKKPLTFFGEQNRFSNNFVSRLSFFKRFLSNCRKNLQENLLLENLRNLYVFMRHNLHSQHPRIQRCSGSSRHRCDTATATTRGFHLFRPNSGVIVLLLVALIPVILLGIKYSSRLLDRRIEIVKTPESTVSFYKKYDPRDVALDVAKFWNPALNTSQQLLNETYQYIYRTTPWSQKSPLGSVVPGLISERSNQPLSPDSNLIVPEDRPTNAVNSVKKQAQFWLENNTIKATANGRTAYAIPAKCNLDISLAVPTNSSSVISEIKSECADFFKNHFFYTLGVYASIIPYSGKLSIPSDRANTWTLSFPVFAENINQQLLICACLYATIGKSESALTTPYSCGNSPCPIMFRRGSEQKESKYGNNPYYLGNLFSTTDPRTADASYKYLKMNLRPCILSAINLLSMKCIANCSEFSPNPNTIMEPVADLTSAYNKCNSLATSGDESNFVFAALEWANNMFQGWTDDPKVDASDSTFDSQAKTTGGRKKAIILVVNKPDHFEPGEMTYVGFSDDWKEQNFSTSETIDLTKNSGSTPQSATGAIKFSGTSYNSGYYQCTGETACKLTCASRRLVKFVVAPSGAADPGQIKFTNVANTTSADKVKKDVWYYVVAQREFFIEATEIAASKEITFSAKNLKFISAEISNRTTNTGTIPTCSISYNGNTATITTNCERAVNLTATQKNSWIKFAGDASERVITGQTTIPLGEKSGNVGYSAQNAEVVKAELKVSWTETGTKTVEHNGSTSLKACRFSIDFVAPEGSVITKIYADSSKIKDPIKPWTETNEVPTLAALFFQPNKADNIKEVKQSIPCEIIFNDYKFNILKLALNILHYSSTTPGTLYFTYYYNVQEPYSINHSETKNMTWSTSQVNVSQKGELTVTVRPKVDPQPSISYTNFNGGTSSSNISGTQTVAIFPRYTKSGNNYTATINLRNVASVSASLTDSAKIFGVSTPLAARSGGGNTVLRNATGVEDPEEAAKSATTAACTKLKQTYGSDIRIYVVKYRKSSGDYTYLDTCATSTGGKSYDVGDSTALKTTLDTIAADLKSWAGYTEARVVD